METSAKDATNVEQAFMAMTADIKNRYIFPHLCVLVCKNAYDVDD